MGHVVVVVVVVDVDNDANTKTIKSFANTPVMTEKRVKDLQFYVRKSRWGHMELMFESALSKKVF